MENRAVISVIIPAYNVEKYIGKCLESVVNQTYRNLEIILINDGSTDGTGDICKDYASRDSRIIYLEQENQGLAETRNVGLQYASGQYLAWVDSDDYIEECMYEELLALMEKSHSQVVICNFDKFNEEGRIRQEDTGRIEEFRSYEVFSYEFKHHLVPQLTHVMWNKLYERELFQNLIFEKGKTCEDYYIHSLLYKKVERITFLDRCLYHYYEGRPDSIMAKSYNQRRLDELSVRQHRLGLVKDSVSKELYQEMMTEYANMIILHFIMIEESKGDRGQKNAWKKEVYHFFKQDRKMIWQYMIPDRKNKIRICGFRALKSHYVDFMNRIGITPVLTKQYID